MRRIASLPARAAAVLLVAFVAFLGTASSAVADTGTGGLPILHSGSSQVAHKCTVIGDDGKHQGVVCVDIETYATNFTGTPTTPYFAWAQIELICQTPSGTTVQCANAYSDTVLSNSTHQYNLYAACGHANGPCSTGRNIWNSDTGASPGIIEYSNNNSSCHNNPSSANAVWVVAYGDTSIELPGSGKMLTVSMHPNDDGNFSTGHYYVCV